MWRSLAAGDLGLDVTETGAGEPVVVVQTALTADELVPLAAQTALHGGFRVIHYHRRGYAGSAGPGRVTVDQEAADCRALVEALDVAPAHVVGASYSGAIVLTLAATAPECVRTVTVIEPPPVHVPSAGDFRAVTARLATTFREHGASAALDQFMTMLAGPAWRQQSERDLPGSVAAMERDASTFFGSDLPALLSWRFDETDAAGIRCPVLYVGGDASGRWFAEVRSWVRHLLPQAEDATVPGAGHLLALSHTQQVSAFLVDYLRRHPRPSPPPADIE